MESLGLRIPGSGALAAMLVRGVVAVSAACFTLLAPLAAAEPRLVKDINTQPAGSGVELGGVLGDQLFFFSAYDKTARVTWVSDSTREGTMPLRERLGQADSWEGGELVALGERFFLPAFDLAHGWELWVSDLTPEGTVLFKDIVPGPAGSTPHFLTPVGDRLFFSVWYPERGRELWVSDGTPEQTVRLTDNDAAKGPSDSQRLTAVGDRLFFSAKDTEHGLEPWISDGTPEGTRLLKDINPGTGDSTPYEFTVLRDQVFFAATGGLNGDRELWVSDGTPEGTARTGFTTGETPKLVSAFRLPGGG